MSTALTKGGNTVIASGEAMPFLLGLTWTGGSSEIELCVTVCDKGGKVLSDEHFLYWENPAAPGNAVLRRTSTGSTAGGDLAQVQVATRDLDPRIDKVVVALALAPDSPENLANLTSVRLRVLDPRTASPLAVYEMGAEVEEVSCLIVGEIYRNQGNWKVRAVGQGYHSGLEGFARDYGVNIA